MALTLLGLAVFCVILNLVMSLRLQDADEGPCGGTRFQPIPINDLSFGDKLKYVPAGSRMNLYAVASGQPRFSEMSELELVSNICLSHNTPMTRPFVLGAAFGFGGQVLANYTVYSSRDQPGVYYTQSTLNRKNAGGGGPGIMGGGTRTITLTDYKTFVFFAHCWTTVSEHKGWEVFSLTPNLSDSTKGMIEEHAVSLGFDREQILFLNYDSCDFNLDAGGSSGQHVGRILKNAITPTALLAST